MCESGKKADSFIAWRVLVCKFEVNTSILERKNEKIIIPLNQKKCLCKHIQTTMIVHFEASHGNVQITLLSKSIVQLWIDLNIIQHNNPINF